MSEKKMLSGGDKNPILAAVLSAICLGGLGQFYLGQQTKAIIIMVATLILSFAAGLGIITWIIGIYEAYAIAQKLQSGESVGADEWAIEALNNIFNK